MAFSFNASGTPNAQGANITIFPDGTSTSITFDVTKQPFNIPFSSGSGPFSVSGQKNFNFSATLNGIPETYQYDMSYSYNPSNFEVTITFTKDPGSPYITEPTSIPVTVTPTIAFSFLYSGLS